MTAQAQRILSVIRSLRRLRPELKVGKVVAIQSSKYCRTVGVRRVLKRDALNVKSPRNTFVIEYNHDFVRQQSDKILFGVLVHEFKHIQLKHFERFSQMCKVLNGETMFDMFCDAADLEVNQQVKEKLPKRSLYPRHREYKDYPLWKTAEEYFLMILSERLGVRHLIWQHPLGRIEQA